MSQSQQIQEFWQNALFGIIKINREEMQNSVAILPADKTDLKKRLSILKKKKQRIDILRDK